MSVEAARRTVVFNDPVVASATEPANPTDGMLWRNTETNVIQVWRADLGVWEFVADHSGTASLIDSLLQGTIENPNFNTLMGVVGPLSDVASAATQTLLGNLAASMDFDESGLTIQSVSAEFAARLGTQQLEFLKGLGSSAVAVAVFGILQTITASYLQVGYTAQSPRLRLGEVIFEYQAATGNLTCRRA